MLQTITKLTAPALAWVLAAPALAQTDPTGIGGEKRTSYTRDDLVDTLDSFANWVLAIVGIIAVIFILYGGFLYITAGGNDEQVQKGKNVIIYGLIGVLIAILAFAIISFAASFLA